MKVDIADERNGRAVDRNLPAQPRQESPPARRYFGNSRASNTAAVHRRRRNDFNDFLDSLDRAVPALTGAMLSLDAGNRGDGGQGTEGEAESGQQAVTNSSGAVGRYRRSSWQGPAEEKFGSDDVQAGKTYRRSDPATSNAPLRRKRSNQRCRQLSWAKLHGIHHFLYDS
ncbi:MAG: hypothetical protein AB7F22_03905 [Reyranella sp.]|uniref:hypothetical protein n=1 Tax=Reyranella sp. TaxID=1929291 RepID=UPI003D126097